MINYVEGELIELIESKAIVDIQGLGYEVICANPYQFERHINETIKIFTYYYVREDQQVLYGFKNREEKTLFSKILSVSGIGPKGALSIIGQGDVSQFMVAIEEENEKYLTTFPGVGKKTARQMILDLKGKLDIEIQPDLNKAMHSAKQSSTALTEAIEALKSLGYKEKEIKAIEAELKPESDKPTDALIRLGLRLLTK
ncbi:Holliday junction DNA helicase subunit RuvA [Streptohalobacillus salinus]|uniref:Holliday junction branch migration complex subunit RuvA n=1 Tax=Streptohalobacillus salinus TaxID=621096 RepID=A0A2V3W7J3_9BACI|nr:Holliday junction branch migration protein RuvA [Streptohalobacillus salinus]PXW90010.1 Holliday junction DNA helicase subunit RuvA [Streptohalobacillus salinus]